MPTLTCSCGKQLRAPDESAGKRVKCPSCGEILTVPGGQTSPPPPPTSPKAAAAPAGMVRFACKCGKQMQAKAQYAGQRTRCPDCGSEVLIPGGKESADKPAAKRAGIGTRDREERDEDDQDEREEREDRIATKRTSAGRRDREEPDEEEEDRPAAKRTASSRRDRDELEEEEEDRPAAKRAGAGRKDRDDFDEEEPEPAGRKRGRRDDEEPEEQEDEDERGGRRGKGRRQQKRSVLPLVLIVGSILLVLGLGGAGLAWFFMRGGSGGLPADLALVPPDAQGFVTLRVADVWKLDATQRSWQNLKKQGLLMGEDPLALLEKQTGLTPADIDRVTVAVVDGEKTILWVILATNKPYDRDKVLKAETNPQEVKHEGRSYFAGQSMGGTRTAYHFADKQLLVLGPEDGVKRCLTFAASKKVPGPLTDAIKQAAGKRHLVGGFNVPQDKAQKAKSQMTGMAQPFQVLLDLQSGTLAMDFGDTLVLDATLKYPSDAKAQEAKKAVDQGKTLAELALPQLEEQMKQNMPPDQAKQGGEQLRATLNNFAVSQQGANLVIKFTADTKALENLMPRAAVAGPGPGIGPGPGTRTRPVRPGSRPGFRK